MILLVAITLLPFVVCGTRVVELVIDDKDVVEEEVKAVEPDN